MATEVGIISALIGTATATATDGTVRNLQIGDKVYPNEIITTGLAGAVEVEFLDGSLMDLGRNSQAMLDNETFDFDNATPPLSWWISRIRVSNRLLSTARALGERASQS